MAKRSTWALRILFLVAAIVFVAVQMKLFAVQSDSANRAAAAVDSENDCQSKMRSLVDKLMTQQGTLMSLEEEKKRLEGQTSELGLVLAEYQSTSLIMDVVAAVVIMTYNRPDYLDRALKSVLKYHKAVADRFPLFVSQDGADWTVMSKARSFSEVNYMQHFDEGPPQTAKPGEIIAYYKIASHYRWALTQLFNKRKFKRVIILEDDMEIAPDFFKYFEATSHLLDNDRTLLAVSAWNDNGQTQFVHDSEVLYRSDFFPGLGWMLTKAVWDELAPHWCHTYWDDWLRLNSTRKGRHFIRPEICRTYNYGEQGSSFGQFYKQYLEPIKLNDILVDWVSKDLSFLREEQFDREFGDLVAKAKLVNAMEALQQVKSTESEDVRMEYHTHLDFGHLARQFGVFQEWKDGIPRTSYKGVVVFRWKGPKRVFFVRDDSLQLLGINAK
ncbi:unnamed protein product [Sphagnum jensenii]|uniref:Alpha-1,3-mannosyl-glycoprotein 2-beta-N-acetylglucosaminyltransferase n=1 Tax=Sphagnum jensenii TaxID=128206 RepID=A0ABP1BWS1_9BRYO